MNMILKNWLCIVLLGIALTVDGIPYANAETKALFVIDFAQQGTRDVSKWLKKQGFDMLLDADELHLTFTNEGLNINTDESLAGMFALKFGKQEYLAEVKYVIIEWGVNRFPKGADWEQEINRVPIALMFSFGNQKLSSGLPFNINAAPYFMSPFIGENEQVGKMYIGKLYKEGGRYFCVSNGVPIGQTIITKFEVDQRFREVFKQDKTPPITGLSFQMNTDDTEGGAEAFIRNISFHSK